MELTAQSTVYAIPASINVLLVCRILAETEFIRNKQNETQFEKQLILKREVVNDRGHSCFNNTCD